ncbi:MAG: OmcA/MtrC family decaheme c-type cytochrome [Archangiaceae bacterium]|nr:OmcA/MtrC family decaheme c-type cytochrome [Archangiaceae bacterium]
MMRHLLVCTVFFIACTGTNGQDGKPCTVTDNGDGSATITCPDGSTTRVTSGKPGQDGMNGMNGLNGDAGTSCSVTSDADAGTKIITCGDGTTVTLRDGTVPSFAVDFSKLTALELSQDDFAVTVQGVTNAPRPVVRFTVKNLKGVGMRNIAPSYLAGISLLQLVPGTPMAGGNGQAYDTWVSHIANCATCTTGTESATASSLVDNGDGTYVYTFAKDVVNPTVFDAGTAMAGVAFDANAVHRFALRFADPANNSEGDKANAFRPVDMTYDYIPATGQNVDGQNDKVNVSNCLTCHTQWRAGALNVGGVTPFHGGQRYDVRYCVVCHNDQRKYSGSNIAGNAVIAEPTIDTSGNMTPPAGRSNVSVLRGEAVINLPVFVHKIHAGEFLKLKGNYAGVGTEVNEFNFPQDLRNCTKCHSNAAKADNWFSKPGRRVCGSCHDKVNFATGEGHGPLNLQMLNDNVCNLCHDPAFVTSRHLPVVAPDPTNALLVTGGNANTNASWVGNPKNAPDGGRAIRYDLAAVTVADGGPTGIYPVVKFRFVEGDAGVVFNAYDGGNELMDNFVGSPSVYCVYSLPQDGIAAPADFNVSMSGYLRNLWAGTATGTGAGALTGPDSQGYYSATLTGGRVPATASQLTCGLGYSYSVTSTLPLTQVNLPAYPYNATRKSGGLSLPAKNVWKVASGYTGRRGATASTSATGQVVTGDKCEACHAQIGVSPNYHAGQRNDPATCAFCHNSNRTSSGWTAGSGSFIHAIHAAKKRTVPFNWHAVGATEDHAFPTGFWGVDYPGRLNACETCHTAGTYDLSGPWYTPANLARRTVQTVATGTYDAVTPTADGGVPSLAISVSPYVVADGGVSYGVGYAYNLTTQAITPAASTTLAISPIANNCFGCHDDPVSRLHMEANGASIYAPRSVAAVQTEQCMICHGPGRLAGIKEVHSK